MTPTYFITLMLSFGIVFAIGAWLMDGYNQDKEKKEIDRQAALDIAFKIAKQTEEKNKNGS
jgi:hypothetical protein